MKRPNWFFYAGQDLSRGPRAWHVLVMLFPDWSRAVEGAEVSCLFRLEIGYRLRQYCTAYWGGEDSTAWTGLDPDWERGGMHLRFGLF